jgi:hypothetical protein
MLKFKIKLNRLDIFQMRILIIKKAHLYTQVFQYEFDFDTQNTIIIQYGYGITYL